MKNTKTYKYNFTISSFTVLVSRNLVIKDENSTSITPKMLSVLIELAKHQGQTLSKAELILAVWGTLYLRYGVVEPFLICEKSSVIVLTTKCD